MTDLSKYGYSETELPSEGLIPARVTEVRRSQYTVICIHGETSAALKGSFIHEAVRREDFPCVGDFVFIQYNPNGPSLITKLLPRRSKFSRADFSGHGEGYVKTVREQVAAANFDYVFIVTSLNKDFKISRIERYLTQAWQSGGLPVVILSKSDLCGDTAEKISQVEAAAPDVPVRAISSREGYGLNALNEYLRPGKTAVFLGMSGVGKSSLLNALMGRDVMTVNQIREDDSRGRHTTTHRQLLMLPSGGMVIDTPGMRELGLFDAEEAIGSVFADIEALFAKCRFSDCNHGNEPGCAVKQALTDGSLKQSVWENYLAQKRENKFADDKAGLMRERKEFHKQLSKRIKTVKKKR